MSRPVVNAFMGAAGWEVAARELGLDVLGIELDPAPVAVSRAAGFNVLQADVAALDPLAVMREHFGARRLWGFVASAPCQPFSSAGKGEGRGAEDIYREAIAAMGRGEPVDYAALDEACGDERAHLILEPLRWALALSPRWIALEQVPPVLPLWEAYADVLRDRGYSCWTGVMSSERYGVPQTRQRAILIASLDREVREPPATHQRYIAPRRREEQADPLFAAPEPERIVAAEDAGLLPWVSMAEALGWQDGPSPSPSPSPSVTAGGTGSGGGVEVFAGREARERAANAVVLRSGQSVAGEGRAERQADEPSLSVISRFDLCSWALRAGTNERDCSRPLDSPAPTIRYGERLNDVSWVGERPSPTVVTTRRSRDGLLIGRQLPAGEDASVGGWSDVEGAPGKDGTAVRVSIAEAAALQSFPPDHPWEAAGTKTAAFRCVGNAIPPLLALHVLGEATGIARQEREAA